jgi:hypothetical protein
MRFWPSMVMVFQKRAVIDAVGSRGEQRIEGKNDDLENREAEEILVRDRCL